MPRLSYPNFVFFVTMVSLLVFCWASQRQFSADVEIAGRKRGEEAKKKPLQGIPNELQTFSCKIGYLQVITSYGTYSQDPLAYSDAVIDDETYQMIRFPAGDWQKGYPEFDGGEVLGTFDIQDQLFLVASYGIYQRHDKRVPTCVHRLEKGQLCLDVYQSSLLSPVLGVVLAVCDRELNFAGLGFFRFDSREYQFTPYRGKHANYVVPLAHKWVGQPGAQKLLLLMGMQDVGQATIVSYDLVSRTFAE